MLVHKYYCRPADEQSETAALDEIARYVQARNGLLRLRKKWLRITDAIILPEYRERAAELRVTPRTGRKPTEKCLVRCTLPMSLKARKQEIELRVGASNIEDKVADLRTQWHSVEVVERGLGRNDREELSAADNRALYADFIAAGGSYATWWLAEAASKKAEHPVRDEYAGRAGILPERMEWDGATMRYGGTSWTVQREKLERLPIPEGARIAQAWLQRERTSSALLRKPRYRWDLVIVLDVDGRTFAVPADRSEAGIDIAWRQDDDGETLRVAYVADSSGAHRSIKMTARQYSRLQHSESLQRLADEDANILRHRFKVPDNTSHRRLCELAGIDPASYVEPSEKRVGPPAPVTPESPSAAIAEHIVHLMDWQHRERTNALKSRDEHYLREVRELCRAHHTIYVEKIKATPELTQKRSTRKKKSESADKGGVARGQRQIAAPFSFLRLLQREAPKFGTLVVEVEAAYTSRTCYACGCDMGPGSQRERSCAACGQRWDIDNLAALNLLGRGTARKTRSDAAE